MTPIEATALLAYHQSTALIDEDPFDISEARVFSVSADGELTFHIKTEDVYLGLQVLPAAYEKIGPVPVVGVETCGWAAPVEDEDDDVAPSEHPGRRRVRLVAVVNRQKMVASAMAFHDDAENVLTNMSGTGSLAKALTRCMDRLILMQSLPKLPSE
jgi:hypothetical protein